MSQDTVTAEELEHFTTDNRREIIFYLHQLIHDGERVSVIFDEGRESLLTILLALDEEAGLLYFDWGGSETTRRKLLASHHVIFVCAPHGVRNQFVTHAVHTATHQGRPAYVTEIPERYTRLQRREFFRLVLPISRRPEIVLKLKDGQEARFSVTDISIGGLALERPGDLPPDLVPGDVWPNVRLDLRGVGTLTVTLELRNQALVERGGKHFSRLGFRFLNLPHALERDLQRFITEVQREERARLA
ncbi:MAG: flagellar brake protein [Rhodocyclaceae bacterium]|nr:flagellar brake protein [Rhodocyclaceae bacterium]